MATQQDIKRRIRSVNNTKKITKAMELVAASRLRRAQARIVALRPYADRMQQLMVDVAAATGTAGDQPLLQRREVQRVAVVALTGDRGLAGGFNANVVRRSLEIAREQRSAGREVTWLVIGRRGASSLRFRRQEIATAYTGITDRPSYADAQ
ncbi:MAG: F-type H+-transporting ATPase subunit gamma, partial [Gaiellales bacterium]|nr:F-type H+-transporting ATPase subunit gamma [Gaiellales bacterium]